MNLQKPLGAGVHLQNIQDTLIAKAHNTNEAMCLASPKDKWTPCNIVSLGDEVTDYFDWKANYKYAGIGLGSCCQVLKLGSGATLVIDFLKAEIWLTENVIGENSDAGKRHRFTAKNQQNLIRPGRIETYFISGDKLMLFNLNGTVIEVFLDDLTYDILLDWQDYGIRRSNQFYSMVQFEDKTILGFYPLEQLLLFNEKRNVISFVDEALPLSEGFTNKAGIEIQSLSLIDNNLVAGVWPWGTVYIGEPSSPAEKFKVKWVDSKRLFTDTGQAGNPVPFFNELIELIKNGRSPIEEDSWGQRITSIVPCWDGICIGTSNKSPSIGSKDDIPKSSFDEYGLVWYLPSKSSAVCPLPDFDNPQIDLVFDNEPTDLGQLTLKVYVNSWLMCKVDLPNIDSDLHLKFGNENFERNGHFLQRVPREFGLFNDRK